MWTRLSRTARTKRKGPSKDTPPKWEELAQAVYSEWEDTPRTDYLSGGRWVRSVQPRVMRMRVEVPPPDPQMLCFQSSIPGCTHAEILSSLESSWPDMKVASLQYDPIHLQDFRDPTSSAPRFKCMWLFKLGSGSDATHLLLRGFRLRGQRMDVRRADDVYAEEQRAFSLCADMIRRGLVAKNFRRPSASLETMTTASLNINNNVYKAAERTPAGTRTRGSRPRHPWSATVRHMSRETQKAV